MGQPLSQVPPATGIDVRHVTAETHDGAVIKAVKEASLAGLVVRDVNQATEQLPNRPGAWIVELVTVPRRRAHV